MMSTPRAGGRGPAMFDRNRRSRTWAGRVAAFVGVGCLLLGGCSSDDHKASDHSAHSSGSGTGAKVEALRPVSEGQPMQQPRRLVSERGTLATTITVRKNSFDVGGARVGGKSYNGAFIGPTLALHRGDT